MTILSKLTPQELSAFLGLIVSLVAYLLGYYRGRHVESVENGEYFCSIQQRIYDTQRNEINWLRSLIDDDDDGDEDDE